MCPGELQAAQSLSVRQPQTVLSLGSAKATSARGIKPQLAARLGWEFSEYKQAGLLPRLKNLICLAQKKEEPQTFIDTLYKHL